PLAHALDTLGGVEVRRRLAAEAEHHAPQVRLQGVAAGAGLGLLGLLPEAPGPLAAAAVERDFERLLGPGRRPGGVGDEDLVQPAGQGVAGAEERLAAAHASLRLAERRGRAGIAAVAG